MELSLPHTKSDIDAKAALRQRMRAIRDAITPTVASKAQASAADNALASIAMSKVGMVAVYTAVRSELGTRPLIEAFLNRGITVAFPRVVRGQLRLAFHRVANLDELTPGYAGIDEPAATTPSVAIKHIDLFIIPGIAFDARGNRIGWGRGHYDVTLAENSHATRVGFAFESQVVDAVPSTSTDLPMDLVITEQRVHQTNRGSQEQQR